MKIILNVFLFWLVLKISALAQIKVSENGKFLQSRNGEPFFWLGDTDWEMFHRLTREEIDTLLAVRKSQGFNVLQGVALAEVNGIRQPNRYGDWPLNNEDPAQLNITPGSDPADPYQYDYWDHVDYGIDQAAKIGLYVGLLPTWGDKVAYLWGDGPMIFNEKNAEAYGELLATRYKNRWNIIWVLGGDRPAVYKSRTSDDKQVDDRPVWRAMARGIEKVLGTGAFITYHPSGGEYRTSDFIHNDGWLDMNAFQSGHGSRLSEAWHWVRKDLSLQPQKPTLDMEPCYEDHPVNPWDGKWTRARGYFTAYDVRARIYRGVFAGACGVTYGHHHIWQFVNDELYPPINIGDTLIGWQKALRAPAAFQMQHLKNLMLSRPYFNRIEDASIIVSNRGTDYTNYVVATRDRDGQFLMVYLPENKPVMVDLKKVSGVQKNVWWFNPVSGKANFVARVKKTGTVTFTPPVEGKDWVLVVDNAELNFKSPGSMN